MSQFPVLVIEDRPENIEAAKQAFAELGIEIRLATTYVEAEEMVKETIFQAVISDVQIPHQAGEEPKAHHNEIEELLAKEYIPHVFLTSGKHPGHRSIDLSYFAHDVSEVEHPELGRVIRATKNQAEAWATAWREILEGCPEDLQENMAQSRQLIKSK